jgi:hypothetical protein
VLKGLQILAAERDICFVPYSGQAMSSVSISGITLYTLWIYVSGRLLDHSDWAVDATAVAITL